MLPLDHYRTLLLDSSFRPIKIIHWTRAITLDLQSKVLVVETYDRQVRSPNRSVALPAVVALRQYLRVKPLHIRWSKRNVFARDHYTCQYCGCQPGVNHLTIDHVLPQSRGGRTIWENTVAACEPCNHRKGDRTPDEAGMPLLSRPYRPTPDRNGLVGPHATPAQWENYLAKTG
jgi:5-methylcytosine-specific restriction endonuclease McrA